MNPNIEIILLLLILRMPSVASAVYWYITGRKVRARYRLEDAIDSLPFSYSRWQRIKGIGDGNYLKSLPKYAEQNIIVHLHLTGNSSAADFSRAIHSVLRQSLRTWRLILTSSDGQFPALPDDHRIVCLKSAHHDKMDALFFALQTAAKFGSTHLVPLNASCTIPPHGLVAYAAHAAQHGKSPQTIFFGDQDELSNQRGGNNPWLKPKWDREMFLSQDYISHSCAIPIISSLKRLSDLHYKPETLFELILLLATIDGVGVEHIARVTSRVPVGSWKADDPTRASVLKRWLSANNVPGTVEVENYGITSIAYDLIEGQPSVSLIIPTRDNVEILQTCVKGILEVTKYSNLDIIIVDNDSFEKVTMDYLDAISMEDRVSVIKYAGEFNYSAINNYAARLASGDFICLLNNDIEIISSDWLTKLMGYATRSEVGAVGAKLLYPDRTVQHAGVVVGMGNAAGHSHRGLCDEMPGYFGHAHVTREASAVTGACLLVRRSDFVAVGGLDEANLAVAYNDIDLCLKLARHGLKTVYVPTAKLIHHESKSRGLDISPENLPRYMQELGYFQKAWGAVGYKDPHFHENLDYRREVYTPIFLNSQIL